jgi:GMP synthase-like glutamine amidotransferase
MSVNDDEEFPWLYAEKERITIKVGRRQPVAGLCPGAQRIAPAFGTAELHPEMETGWSDGTWSGRVPGAPLSGTLRVSPWHEKTLDLPGEALFLCIGDRVQDQAALCRSAPGVPFLREATQVSVSCWIPGRAPPLRAPIETAPCSSCEGSRQISRIIIKANVAGGYVRGA